jgi:glycosyltransferase involved in cell wall biosynthesis
MSALPIVPPIDPATAGRQAAAEGASRPLRLLLSVPEPHPTHRADVAVLFGRYLPRHGVQSDLVGCHAEDPPPPWPGGQALTRRAPSRGVGRHLGSLLADLRLLPLARRGYDAVVVRDKTLGALVGLMAARLAGVPFIYWMSFPMVEAWAAYARERGRSAGWLRWAAAMARGHLLSRLLYGVILPRSAQIFVQSDVMRDEMIARGLPAQRLVPVPMGVDAEAGPFRAPVSEAGPLHSPVAEARSLHAAVADTGPVHAPVAAARPLQAPPSAAGTVLLPLPVDAPIFGYLGTLNRVRRPEVMIEAFTLLHRERPDARLLLVGDCDNAPDRAWLAERIAAAGPAAQAIELTGWLPTDEGWRRMAGCVAGLSPFPRGEIYDSASPTKVVEYFALGLPVLANDQPDQAAMMAAAGGQCVPLTAEGFAAGMRDVLARGEFHRAVATHGQAWVAKHRSYAVLAAGVGQAFRDVLPARPPGGRVNVMLGPGLGCRGGIASVCASYRDGGLFQRLDVRYLSTFEQGSAARKLVAAASALLRFSGLLLARRVGVVHVHVATNASFWRKAVFCELARLARVPVLLHLHSGDTPAFLQRCGAVGRRWVMRTLRGAQRVIVLSAEWQAWLRTLDPTLPTEVLPNPVPPAPAGAPAQARSAEPSVLFLGRLQAAKGVPELITAFADVRQRLPGARLVLCGEGDRAAVHEQLAALKLLGAVDCPGWVEGEHKRALLASSWVFALPSHHEGVPVGMLEAMAAGLPAVGTPVGGVPGLLRASEGGLLVPVGDAAALAQALLTLLTDRPLAEGLGAQGQRHVQAHHGLDVVERRLVALYAQARAERAVPRERARA